MASQIIESVLRVKDDASKALKGAGEEGKKTTITMDKLAVAMVGLGAVAVTLGKAWLTLQQRVADATNELGDMSLRTGVSTRTLAGLRLAAEGAGTSLSELEGGLRPLARNMFEASQGAIAQAAAFKRVGVDVNDAEGNLRSVDSVFLELLPKLGDMGNETERAATMMAIMGEESAKLTQALGGNLDTLDAFVRKAELFGASTGPKAARSAALWQRAMADLNLIWGLFLDTIGKLTGAGGAASGIFKFIGALIREGLAAAFVFQELMIAIQAMFNVVADDIEATMRFIRAVVEGDFKAMRRAQIDLINTNVKFVGTLTRLPTVFSRAKKAAKEAELQYATLTFQANKVALALAGIEEQGKKTNAVIAGAPTAAIVNRGDNTGGAGFAGGGFGTALMIDAMRSSVTQGTADGLKLFRREAAVAGADLVGGLAGAAGQVSGGNVVGGVGAALGAAGASNPFLAALMAIVQLLEGLGKVGAEGIRTVLEEHRDNVAQGIRELPELLAEVIPDFAVSFPKAIVAAILETIPILIQELVAAAPDMFLDSLITAFFEIPKMIVEAISPFDSDGKIGVKEQRKQREQEFEDAGLGAATGITSVEADGMFRLHKGETVIPSTGTGTGTGMEQARRAGAGANVNINVSGILGPESIRQLIDQLNQHLGSEGTGEAFAT